MATASTTVRNSVNKIRINEGGVNTPVQKTNTSSTRSNSAKSSSNSAPSNLDIIEAATAVYRSQNAPKDKPYTITNEQKTIFETAQKTLADKNGIIPDENGKFREEHLENELSPLNVIKQFSFDHYKESVINHHLNNDTPYLDIDIRFGKIYKDESHGQKEEIPDELKNVNTSLSSIKTFYTDTDFLALQPKEQQEYLESIKDFGAEVDYLTKLLEGNSTAKDKDHKAAHIENKNKDTDPPKFGDKDFSTKQKDIIDWMLEEVIMPSIDWVANRTIDAATYTLYGSTNVVLKGLYRSTNVVLKGTDKIISKVYQKYVEKKQQEAKNKEKEQKLNESALDTALDELKQEKNALNQNLKTEQQFSQEQLAFFDGLIDHSTVIEDDYFINNGKETPYNKIFSDNKDIKNRLEEFQQSSDAICLFMLNDEINKDKDPKTSEALKTWYESSNQNIENSTRGSQTNPIDVPKELKEKGFTEDSLQQQKQKTFDTYKAFKNIRPILSKMEKATAIFAQNYATYKLCEMARTSEEERSQLDDPKKVENLTKKFKAEGTIIMCQNYEALRNGSSNALSEDKMLQISENMANKSEALYKEKDSKTPSPNFIEQAIKPPSTKTTTPQSLADYTNNLSFEDVTGIEMQNLKLLENEEKSLQSQQNDLDTKRNAISQLRKNIENAHNFSKTKGVEKTIVGKIKREPQRN